MTVHAGLILAVFIAVVLIGLVIVWRLARRMKDGYDAQATPGAGARVRVEMTPDRLEQLRLLSAEPILLKQGPDGIRVQIEQRPMVPLVAFVGKDVSTALNEAAFRVTESLGPVWVVLVSPGGDGRLDVQRLA